MPAIFLCAVVLLSAATIGWAQDAPDQPVDSKPPPGRTEELARIRASVEDTGNWQSLGTLARAATRPDRSLAAKAARGASDVAHRLDAFDVDEQEIPHATLKAFQLSWLRVATDTERWVDIRVYALDVAAHLARLRKDHGEPGAEALWRTFLDDPDPQMRAAAITLVPDAPELTSAALKLLVDGRSEEVSLAAAQRLCGPLGSTIRNVPEFGPEALARLQQLAIKSSLPIFARADTAPCLIREGSVQSRRALAILLQRSPPALRRNLREATRVPARTQAP